MNDADNYGIKRINITTQTAGRGSWRFRDSEKLHIVANDIYRSIFDELQSPLELGYKKENCTIDQFKAGYDYLLGIDTILRTIGGQRLTMQEKFLFTKYNTVTVEYMQNPQIGEEGDWYKLSCQLYFVGYDYPKTLRRFSSYILLDWPAVVIETQRGNIPWKTRSNTRDGARASFKYVKFNEIPSNCCIYRGGNWQKNVLTS